MRPRLVNNAGSPAMRRAVVTGAFSYTGAAVARELIERGWSVHTLTNRQPPEGAAGITAAPLRFEADHLARELDGADLFVNTYWVRLPARGQDFDTARKRSEMLVAAAVSAGVGRLVHVSVSNAAAGRALGYYGGKAKVEDAVRAAGLSHAIVRPTLVVGPNDVLTNNMAWFLRRSPFFLLPRAGSARLSPITLDDTARIIVGAAERSDDAEMDAAGPDTMTFTEYIRCIARACGVRRLFLRAPDTLVLGMLRTAGWLLRDVILTREELLGLEQELLVTHAAPLGHESVPDWLMRNGPTLGRRYINDMRRHFGAGAQEAVVGVPRGR